MRVDVTANLKSYSEYGNNAKDILLVAVMSQIGIWTSDWSIAAVPCYYQE